MADAHTLPLWGRDNALILKRILSSPSTLQIILKTRNEVHLLEKWLLHTFNIIEDTAKIIILDHMSTEKAIFDIYKRYAHRLIVLQYEGLVDSAHSPAKFQNLYDAVCASASFYALLDTDEFLCLYDGFKLVRNQKLISFLQANAQACFFPSLALENILGEDSVFAFYAETARSCLLHGKPILNTRQTHLWHGMAIGHNADMPGAACSNTPLGLVLLHLTSWLPEQRIRANMQKLVNFGVITSEHDFYTVMTLDSESIFPEYLRTYIKNIRLLSDAKATQAAKEAALQKGFVTFAPEGKPLFSPATMRRDFKDFTTGTSVLSPLGMRPELFSNPRQRIHAALTAQNPS